jgi:Ca-activated chloride channel family protein
VLGLTAADFEVLDNGVPQSVDFVSSERLPLNLILVLDASGSVSGEPLEHLRSAGLALLDRLEPADQVALLTFSEEVRLWEGLTRNLDRVGRALEQVEPRGQTAVIDASYAGIMLGEAEVGRDLMIVFSDGLDTSSWLTREQVLDAARFSDLVVYGVSLRGEERPDFLRELSRLTGGSLLEVDSTHDVSGAFVRIFDEFRHRYLVNFSPLGVAPGGWHALEVRVRGSRARVQARAGYMARR